MSKHNIFSSQTWLILSFKVTVVVTKCKLAVPITNAMIQRMTSSKQTPGSLFDTG